MEYINIGTITSTHGIKGELKIKSDFKDKDLVFKVGNVLYIGKDKEKLIINSYRPHKGFDMVMFPNYNDINEVLKYIKKDVYFSKEDFYSNKNVYLNEDIINYEVIFNNNVVGRVIDIVDGGNGNELIKLESFYIPNKDNFVKKIDIKNKKIYVLNIEGLM